jgi:hypothetical protein
MSDASIDLRMTVNGPPLLVEVGFFDVPLFSTRPPFFSLHPSTPSQCRSITARKAAAFAAEEVEGTLLRETVLAEHEKGGKSVRKLALKYGMSPAAVGRLVSGKTRPSSKRGRAKTLPTKIEEQLVQALIRCSHAHVGFDPDAFRRGVGYYMEKAGLEVKDGEMGAGWYESFMKRHKHRLSSLKGRSISKARSFGFNRVAIDDWCRFIGPLAKKFKAEETFNCDDTGLNMEVLEDGRVLGERGGGQPQVRIDETKSGHIGVTLCAPAKGEPVPLLFVFKGEVLERNYALGAGEDDVFVLTSNGWPTAGTYFRWAHMFVAHMKKHGIKKALLYCDNADIHINQEINKFLLEHNVCAVGLIKAGSHKHQPLDVSGIQNIKTKLRSYAKGIGLPYKKEHVMRIFRGAMDMVIADRRNEGKWLLQAGFLKTGLVPFNQEIFDDLDFSAGDAYFGLDNPAERARAQGVVQKRYEALAAVDPLQALADFDPRTRDVLGADAAAAKAKRLSAMLAKLPGAKDAEGRIDVAEAVADRVWTSQQFTEHKAAKAAAKAAEKKAREEAAAAAAAVTAERHRLQEEAKAARAKKAAETAELRQREREAIEARKAERAAKAAAAAVQKAARQAAHAAQQAEQQAAQQAQQKPRKRARDVAEDDNAYEKRYIKKSRR